MEVVVVYRGRIRAPREARVVFWECVRSGVVWQDAAVDIDRGVCFADTSGGARRDCQVSLKLKSWR